MTYQQDQDYEAAEPGPAGAGENPEQAQAQGRSAPFWRYQPGPAGTDGPVAGADAGQDPDVVVARVIDDDPDAHTDSTRTNLGATQPADASEVQAETASPSSTAASRAAEGTAADGEAAQLAPAETAPAETGTAGATAETAPAETAPAETAPAEPVPAETGTAGATAEPAQAERESLSAEHFGQEWREIQASFVDDPRGAVQLAAAAAEAALTGLVTTLRERHAALGPATKDTEELRAALREYRRFCQAIADVGRRLPQADTVR